MSTTSEIIRELCRKNGISVTTLEAKLGFGNGSLTKGASVRGDRLLLVAQYFSVPVEYLLTGEMPVYYYDNESAELAQKLFDDPNLRILFDAAQDSKPEDLQMAADMLQRFKETNIDG